MEKFVSVGKDIGLSGEELLKFVRDESEKEKEREERVAQRDLKKMQLDFEAKEKEFLLEMEKLKIGHVKSGSGVKTSHATAKVPKLPPFNEKQDSMDAYLKRFERFAENASWDKDSWATNLSALLQGKYLDVYSRLSVDDAMNYDALKTALLKRFQLTEEGFRNKFRTSRSEVGETPRQFVIRLEDYLLRWMDLAKVSKTFEGLKDMVLREQFMQASSKSLQIFLKERKVDSVLDMADLAEQYQEAHGVQSVTPSPGKFNNPFVPMQTNESKNVGSSQSDRGRHCYACRGGGHIARDCPKRFTEQKFKVGAFIQERGGRGRGSFISRQSGVGRGGYRGRGQVYNHGDRGQDSIQNNDGSGNMGCFFQLRAPEIIPDEVSSIQNVGIVPVVAKANIGKQYSNNMPVAKGLVNDREVAVLRDTGCSSVVVRRDLVDKDCITGRFRKCILIDGTVRRFPVATVFVDTPFYTGNVEALCAEYPVYDLIIGNIPNVKDPKEIGDAVDSDKQEKSEISEYECGSSVQSRAQRAKENERCNVKTIEPIADVSVGEFKKAQEEDSTLDKVREKEKCGEVSEKKSGAKIWFGRKRELLYRYFQSNKVENGKVFQQVCVPKHLRGKVLKVAHDSLMAGHLGIKKTYEKILYNFWWPGLNSDVTRYCRSCDICQKTFPKGKAQKIPIGKMPIIDSPFERVAIDIVGPINPPSDRKHRFILTMVDYASRYPEAVPLKQITTESVAEALFEMFSRVGVPREVLSDMGKQFTSDLMREINRLLSVKQLTTTPYNPACNGLVERFNGTLKTMLKKMCAEQPRDWDKCISAVLFAYREAPQESTGFSPFELLYGRTVRGPLQILKELWTKELESEETKTTYQYVVDLRNRLEDTLKIAQKELAKNQGRYKVYADKGKKAKSFKVGDKVLVLLPTDKSKLLMHLQGPFVVVERVNSFDYRVRVKGKDKIYHANLLKKYVERDDNISALVQVDPTERVHERNGNNGELEEQIGNQEVCVAVVEDEESSLIDADNENERGTNDILRLELLQLHATEGVEDVQINPELSESRKNQLKLLVREFSDVLTDVPGDTDLIQHEIKLTSDVPVRSKPYPMPFAVRESFKTDIQTMLKLGIIEPCDSPYASPVVIVKKPDGTNRVCVDYRKVNAMTVFDSEPLGNPDYIFDKLSGAKFFTKIDLSKGYWQIRVKESCKPYTAFVCSEGLFWFNRMPFGMVNSGATFCKMMRKLLDGLDNIDNFVDDILDFTNEWECHIVSLRGLFERLRSARLTARPSKCKLGYTNIDFLGHVAGDGKLQPNPEKIKALQECKRPTTKTQVRSFLGLVGYYRKFVPNFSSVAACLTDMTKKGCPNKVVWSDEAEMAFRSLIGYLVRRPVLCLPDWSLEFVLRTDASEEGIGCALMQEHGESNFPVAYASRKLLSREKRYSTIEKEGLAIVWAVQKFQCYLYGREFVLETDHSPLIHMNRAKVSNPRIMRWVLALQPYRFRIQYVKGSENVGADFLSRSEI